MTVLFLAWAAPPAQAQMSFDAGGMWSVPNYAGPLILGKTFSKSYLDCVAGAACRRGGDAASGTVQPGKRTTGPSFKVALGVGHDPAVSAQVKKAFRDQLVAADPQRRADIDRAMAQDWLKGYRNEIARPNGLDADNLADAVTAYSVAAWAIIHKQAQIDPRAIAAVRDRTRASLSVSPELAGLPAADRQRLAEDLIYQTVLIMANRTSIHQSGNRQLADAAAAHYRKAAQTGLGVDLGRVALTRDGFRAR